LKASEENKEESPLFLWKLEFSISLNACELTGTVILPVSTLAAAGADLLEAIVPATVAAVPDKVVLRLGLP